MNLGKLARYLSGELPNTKPIQVAEFFSICENNRGMPTDELKKYKHRIGSLSKDFEDILNIIKSTENWEWKIIVILEWLWLEQDFVWVPDFEKHISEISKSYDKLYEIKKSLLEKVDAEINILKKSGNNKMKGNGFEELCEKFLLNTSYFEPWFKEFKFEDWTEKIDRLLKLKKDIWNFNKWLEYLWYVILESKYKLKDKSGAGETAQLNSYIDRLNDYWVSRYAIVITSTDYKDTYKTKLSDTIRKRMLKENPFYISILTIEEIKKFLENKWEYENMGFDEFIERSFIKRLK